MDTSQGSSPATDGCPGPLMPEKVRRARERTAAIHEELCLQKVSTFRRCPILSRN